MTAHEDLSRREVLARTGRLAVALSAANALVAAPGARADEDPAGDDRAGSAELREGTNIAVALSPYGRWL
ncbi:MAG: hypothetical protein HOQ46_03080, partial [Saccharothrix sp.]|nr:hypothetical protein [Saccharothrix sp.]